MRPQSRVKTFDKSVAVEWLGQVADRPGRERLRTSLLIRKRGEENERNATPLGTQVILQLDTAHTGHLDVRDDACDVVDTLRPQELFGRYECTHDISERS